MADKLCGAKTRSGGRCRHHPMPNGRCHLHGGKSTGPKDPSKMRGNTRALTHGFYSDALQPEERDLWDRVEVGTLDDEIRLMRVKLHRLVRLSGTADVAELVDAAIEVAKKHDQHPTLGDIEKREIKVKAARYGDLIVQAIETIRKLELARRELARVDPNTPPPPQEPVTEFRVTVVTPENYRPDSHGTRD